mmetsp:Transcript_36670/g.77374  ORF Transcript_36670/g.77374 Transcript_36670/m.77374 type:complete len:223 (-) Transcript_36670:1461-2129(-)
MISTKWQTQQRRTPNRMDLVLARRNLVPMTVTPWAKQPKMMKLIPIHPMKHQVNPRRQQSQALPSPKSRKIPHGRQCSERKRKHSPNKRNSKKRAALWSTVKPRKRRRKRALLASKTLDLPSNPRRATMTMMMRMQTLTKMIWIMLSMTFPTGKAMRKLATKRGSFSKTPRKNSATRKSCGGCARVLMDGVAELPATEREERFGLISWWLRTIERMRNAWDC